MASRPILFIVDDEPEVLRAIELDVRIEYGSDYRVIRADTGTKALETLHKLKLRADPVALFLVDQRMPQMTGVEFLERAIPLYPDAKRVLLTAYSDIDAAITAINRVGIDYYLLKPWDPPEELLYPVINDLLDDWLAQYRPPFEGIRVAGHRWSPAAHRLRDFLARNQVPYKWLDVESDDEAKHLAEMADVRSTSEFPLVVFADGGYLVNPTTFDVAEKIGLKVHAEMPFYDLVIVGGGPGGLAAGVYGASEGLRTVIIECEAPGGQAGTSSRIENYLGFPKGLSGADLARRAVAQARRFGAEILCPQEAVGVRVEDPYRYVKLADGTELGCYALLIATGVSYNRLDISGIDGLTGAGVYYGATMTEAISYEGQNVFIVGAGNSAGQAALFFAQHAHSTTVLVRGESLATSMSQYLIDQIEQTPSVSVMLNTQVIDLKGNKNLAEITVRNTVTGDCQTAPANALFIFIGATPHTDWLGGIVERDEDGYVLSGQDLLHGGRRPQGWMRDRDPFLLETSVPGIFVAGDVRYRSIKRVASAVGEGAMSIQFVHEYLREL
jgi:thioredoxin reductase (NADPH)